MTRDTCQTCGERAWGKTSDDRGGTVYVYNCTAELVLKKDGTVRVLKACPNWEKRSAIREDL